jgi:AAA domain-containing protein/Toprim domain-containing protein
MANLLSIVNAVKSDGRQRGCRCPAHDDHRESLSVGLGNDGHVLLHCFVGCSLDDICAAVSIKPRDLFLGSNGPAEKPIVATYRYHDEESVHLYDVVRFDPKDFRQRRADGVWSMAGVRRVAFGLPELQGQPVAYIPEGEKDVLALRKLGLVATTNPGGASKWRDDYTRQLVKAGVQHVVILPDGDDAGRTHAVQVAQSCHAAGLNVKVLELPNLPAKGDISDWVAAGYTAAELIALVKATAMYQPEERQVTSAVDELALTSLSALLDEPDDAIEWEIDGLIAVGSLNLLAGKPKAGKSTLARQMALCMAAGTPFLGRACVGGSVWYFALEDKRSEVRRHFRGLGATGGEPVRLLFGNTRDLLAKVARLAERERPRAIIIDTLQRLIGAKDLNDYSEVTTRLDPVLAIARNSGAAVILVHHAAKADRAGIDSVLGSTALTGSVDNVFLLNRTERYRVLSSIQRIGTDLEEMVIELDDFGCIQGGQTRHAADVAHVKKNLVAAITATPNLTRAECCEAVDGRKTVKLEALREIIASGTTICTGTGKKGDPFRYAIADSGSLVPSKRWEPEFSSPTLLEFPHRTSEKGGSQVPADLDSGSGGVEPAFSFDPERFKRAMRGEKV